MNKVIQVAAVMFLSVLAHSKNTVDLTRGFNLNSPIKSLNMDDHQIDLTISNLTVIVMKKEQSPEILSDQNMIQTYYMPISKAGDVLDCEVQVDSTLAKNGEVIRRGTEYRGNYFMVRKCGKSEQCKKSISAGFTAPEQGYLRTMCREVGTLRKTVALDQLAGDDATKVQTCQSAGGRIKIDSYDRSQDLCQNMKVPATFETLRAQLAQSGLYLRIKDH